MTRTDTITFDAFVSYSTTDRGEADALVAALEKRGLKCWIAPRNVAPAAEYSAEIIGGIEASKCMIVLLSQDAVESRFVRAEVERGATLGRQLLPVAIEEVTLRHGLDFFLSLRQRIDLFDGSRKDHLDRIAAIIRTEEARPIAYRPKARLPRWILWSAGSILFALTFWLLTFGVQRLMVQRYARDTQNVLEKFTRELPRISPSAKLPEIRPDSIEAQFNARWSGQQVVLSLRELRGVPPTAHISLSTDGAAYVPTNSVVAFGPADRLLIKLSAQRGGPESGPFDYTAQAQAAARAAVAKEFLNRNGSRPLSCSAQACRIERKDFCGGNWTKLTLGRRRGQEEFTYDLRACPGPELTYMEACYGAPHDIFPMRPGEMLYGALHTERGEPFQFELPVETALRSNLVDSGDHYVELEPAASNAAPATPYAVAWVTTPQLSNKYPFRIAIGAGGCRGGVLALGDAFRAIFYDVDGKGLTQGQLRYFSVPEPRGGVVHIAFETKDGRRLGPFSYKFDMETVIRKAIDSADKPVLQCGVTGRHRDRTKKWECAFPNRQQSVFQWAKVDEVRYGADPARLERKLGVSLGARDVLAYQSRKDTSQRPPIATIAPLADWSDFYFTMIYTDGSQSAVQRIPLKD